MCDECGADEAQEFPAGTAWHDAGSTRLHWTDPFIFAFIVVEEIGNVVRRLGNFGAGIFKSHANGVGRRRAVGEEMALDLERIIGES